VPKSKAPKPQPPPGALKRERAGTYRSNDGRFTVEQSSSGWLAIDAEQTDGLGLPLARGPFGTLDEAKAAMAEARGAPAPEAPKPNLRLLAGGTAPARTKPEPAPQRERALVVVFRHFLELVVLHDLQHPEARRQSGECHGDDVLEDRETRSDAAALFNHRHDRTVMRISKVSSRRARPSAPSPASPKKSSNTSR